MSFQRIFALFICIIALFGIIGSLKVPLVTVGNIAEGFAPLLYSLVLFMCGIFMFISDKSGEKLNIRRWFLEGAHGKAFGFFLLNILFLILLFVFGSLIAVLAFSILASFVLKRQTPQGAVSFSIIYTIAFYVVFVVLLKMQFDRGIIFELLR